MRRYPALPDYVAIAFHAARAADPAPKLFYRWKERHQVRFSIAAGDVELEYPAKFTTCMQEADDHSWWMFPQEDDTWLCACKTE